MVFGNPSELKEVVTNILFNAVEAMPRGGKSLWRRVPWDNGWS